MIGRFISYIVIVWLPLDRTLLVCDGFVIPVRTCATIPSIARRPGPQFWAEHDDWNDSNKEQSYNDDVDDDERTSESQIISYNDFDDFEFTTKESMWMSSSPTVFNDFADHMVGTENDDIAVVTPQSSLHDTTLSARMTSVQREEQRRVAVCDRNWKLGNWFVRGFSLEATVTKKHHPHDEDDALSLSQPLLVDDMIPIPSVSTIVTSSLFTDRHNDESDQDEYVDPNLVHNQVDVWVGRTDGSVFGIRFGTDYWTRLGTSTGSRSSSSSPDPTLDAIHDHTNMEEDDSLNFFDENDGFENVNERTFANLSAETNPFTIVTQFQCTESSEISSIVAVPAISTTSDDDDDSMTFDIYVANKESSTIEHWYCDGHTVQFNNTLIAVKDTNHEASSIRTLKQIRPIVNNLPTTMMLSVNDCSMTLWDIPSDSIMGGIDNIKIPDSSGRSDILDVQTITCLDTDHDFIYVGTASGYVLVYAILDLIRPSIQSESVSAVGCWRAAPTDDCAITAIKCGGPGTLGRNSVHTTSSILYTGDAQGLVKQWEVLKMETTTTSTSASVSSNGNDGTTNNIKNQYKVEAWPKLSTQRLPKKAHVFTGHDAAVTGLLSVDALKFVSASADGTGMFRYKRDFL